jgi:hypothetical protein
VANPTPEHERRARSARNVVDETTRFTTVYPSRADAPLPEAVVQGGGGATYRMIPYLVRSSRVATAGPPRPSAVPNVADHVPDRLSDVEAASDSPSVPSPETESLSVPDQLPAGDEIGVGEITPEGGIGALGAAVPPQPATTARAIIGANWRRIRPL